MIDYLNTPHYYSENLMETEENLEVLPPDHTNEQSEPASSNESNVGMQPNDYMVLDNDLRSNTQSNQLP